MNPKDKTSKWKLLLKSRKFWGSVAALCSTVIVHFVNGLDPVVLTGLLTTIFSVFIIGTAIEDAGNGKPPAGE